MPSRPTSSRIEVDLKLLKDANVARLEEFGKQFGASIDRLATTLENEAKNIEGLVQQRAGRLSDNASTGARISTPQPPGARLGGSSTGNFGGGNYSLGGGGYGGGASVAPTEGGFGQPTPGSFEEQFVRAQRRIGEIPVGLRQALGYYAEGGFSGEGKRIDNEGFFIDDNGVRTGGRSQSRLFAGKVNSYLFQTQAIGANLRLGMGHLNNIYASIAGPTQLGQQLGASREGGWLGTGFMSPAFRRGFSENFRSAVASDFGLNPNYSMAQAQAARATTQSMGYSGHMADVINEQMKQLQIHQGLDPGTVMSMLDPLLRYGGWQNGQQLVDVLRSIPEAAKAASFNLKTFTDQLTQTSLQIAQETGMQPGQVASALASFSSVTGLAPSRAAGLFTSNNLTLAAAMTGKTMTQLVENPSAAPEMAFGQQIFRSMTGMNAEQLLRLRQHNRALYNHVMDGVYRLYEQNKEIFGGFSPLELINMSVRNRGRTRQHMAVTGDIRNMELGAGSVDRMESLIAGYGPHSKNLVRQFQQWRDDYLTKNAGHLNMQKYRQAAQDEALKVLGDNQQRQGRRAAVEITLSPDAKRWFDLITKNTGQQDTPGRNAMKNFWRSANHFGTNNLGGELGSAIGGHTGREIGGWATTVAGVGGVEDAIHSLGW